ncbi:MAG: hypothetical protein LBU53_12355 [Zoogloeaceae bacterium]|nr:hypothetical protein [Zoogloeaceae bacterium]
MSRSSHHHPQQNGGQISRAHIASVAARLMAQDGITDMGLAKKKAARQLGQADSALLPDNAEVEAELRLYQALYQGDAQPARLRFLREEAARAMRLLADFTPYLTGSVLDGTAGAHSAIDLLLFADSAKDVEIFLLDHNIVFDHAEPRNDKAEAVLRLTRPDTDIHLIVFPHHLERHHFRHRDGRARERLRLDGLEQLLESA